MSSSNVEIFIILEIAIVAFSIYRAKGKGSSNASIDINSPIGGAATFNFWFIFLNSLVGAIVLENIFFAIVAAVLLLIRMKIKKN
jgi:hypothetical protein